MADEGVENTRSKRTCVRVRQEISKLQEILNDDVVDAKPTRVGGRGKGRGGSSAGSGRISTGANRSIELASDDAVLSGSGLMPPSKKKRSSYSQFTHKRRKRKRKPPEEGKELFMLNHFLCLPRKYGVYIVVYLGSISCLFTCCCCCCITMPSTCMYVLMYGWLSSMF